METSSPVFQDLIGGYQSDRIHYAIMPVALLVVLMVLFVIGLLLQKCVRNVSSIS